MKQILSRMYGYLEERAIVEGLKEERGYDFSETEIKCWVTITEEGIKTEFTVRPKAFCTDSIYTTNSFSDLRKWLEEHKDELK